MGCLSPDKICHCLVQMLFRKEKITKMSLAFHNPRKNISYGTGNFIPCGKMSRYFFFFELFMISALLWWKKENFALIIPSSAAENHIVCLCDMGKGYFRVF